MGEYSNQQMALVSLRRAKSQMLDLKEGEACHRGVYVRGRRGFVPSLFHLLRSLFKLLSSLSYLLSDAVLSLSPVAILLHLLFALPLSLVALSFLPLYTILLNIYNMIFKIFLIIWLGNNFNLATDNMFNNTNSQAFLIIESLLKLLLSNYRTLIKLYTYYWTIIIIDRFLIIRIGERN